MSTSMCPNGHPVASGDHHCGECGAVVSAPVMLCANGHSMTPGERFCGTCGAQSQVAAPIASAPMPTAAAVVSSSAKSRKTLPIVIGVIVLAALIAGGVAFAVTRKSKDSSSNASASTTVVAPTTTAGPTTTAVDRVKAQIVAIDGILTTSAVGRASLSSILADVQSRNCTNNPGVAMRQIQSVADNRKATIDSLQKIDGSVSPAVADMKASLLRGLQASYSSDVSYSRAVDTLYQCGPLSPSQADMAAAAITDSTATAGKQAFIDVYNPLAAQYGLRSDWIPRDL